MCLLTFSVACCKYFAAILFILRSAPHRSEAKILHCTVQVLPMIDFGATRLHKQPEQVCHV
ncbi:hypothetical protein BKN65_17590 [Salmonella enterica]|nr:hypothetical protein [Salmonella enterica]